jgi:hypothetical protein
MPLMRHSPLASRQKNGKKRAAGISKDQGVLSVACVGETTSLAGACITKPLLALYFCGLDLIRVSQS